MSDQHVQQEHHSLFEDEKSTRHGFPVAQQLVVLSVILLTIFGTGFMPTILAQLGGTEERQSATIPLTTHEQTETPTESIDRPDYFEDISVAGTAAFVFDVQEQRVLYEKNPDQQLPLASITKLMTALVAHEIIAGNETVPISISAVLQDGDSGLRDGERFTLDHLTDLTLMNSSNDGAFAIAAAAGAMLDTAAPAKTFVEAMNIRADELGLSQTYFRNPTGLDISEAEAGAYGSARDVAILLEHILIHNPGILERTTENKNIITNNDGAAHQAENTNYVVDEIPGIIGSKTGYTTLAGGNLAVAFDASLNRPIVAVVLNSTRSGRFNDILQLTEAARKAAQ